MVKRTGPIKIKLSWQLRIELLDVAPTVWRRLIVPETIKLPKLDRAIQTAFGWTNSHLHEFIIGGVEYAHPDPDWAEELDHVDEYRVDLSMYPRARVHRMNEVRTNWRSLPDLDSLILTSDTVGDNKADDIPRLHVVLRSHTEGGPTTLSSEKLPNHEGLRLMGTAESLREFHTLLHDVNERSVLIRHKEGFFLALAYDVRKAYEGQRTKRKPNPDVLHAGRLLGVEILWPTLLVQARMLRASLGFMDSTKRHQAYTYALEAIIEDGLKRDFGSDYDAIHEQYLLLSPEHPYLEDAIVSRIELYAAWSGAERRRRIINLLESLDPMYSWHYSHRLENGESGLLSPDQWDAGTDREPALDH